MLDPSLCLEVFVQPATLAQPATPGAVPVALACPRVPLANPLAGLPMLRAACAEQPAQPSRLLARASAPVVPSHATAVLGSARAAERTLGRRFSCIDLNARGPGCFDDAFYNTENVDLHDKVEAGSGFDAGQAWHHFLHNGQFEGRHYRWGCPASVEDVRRLMG